MKGFGIDPKLIAKELNKNSKLKISLHPNEMGEYCIDFNDTEEELLKQLNCIRFEDAINKLVNLQNR